MRAGLDPLFRWAGSKRQVIGSLLPSVPDPLLGRYVEPFAGSACLFFRVGPRKAILGDLNGELIHAYQQVRIAPVLLADQLAMLPVGEDFYYEIRGLDPTTLEPNARAARFIYLNRFCFNGLYRTNRQGQFNVPFGGDRKNGRLPTVQSLQAYSRALAGAELRATDFTDVLSEAQAGDFAYIDPPYAVNESRVHKEYTPSGFDGDDLERLRQAIDDLVARGASFVLSYADVPEATLLSSGFEVSRIQVRRHIAGFADARRRSHEILVSNMSLPRSLPLS